jgi:transcriptional antiterminator NusG
MAQRWYALHTYSGHENKVKTYLESLIEAGAASGAIAQVVVPTEEVVELRAGKKTVVKKRFFAELCANRDGNVERRLVPGY